MLNQLIRLPMRATAGLLVAMVTPPTIAPALATNSYSIELTADQVAPSPADPDGEGRATISVHSQQGRICYELAVEGIQPATAAHVHAAAAGRIGPVRLELDPPVDGSAQGCVRVDRDFLGALQDRPQFFYIDVHTSEFPGAALRGQLGE